MAEPLSSSPTACTCARAHLAPLTGDDPVVNPRRLVPTDLAGDHFDLSWKREGRRSAQEPPPRRPRGQGRTAGRPTPAPRLPRAKWKERGAKRCSARVRGGRFFCLFFAPWGGWEVYQLWGPRTQLHGGHLLSQPFKSKSSGCLPPARDLGVLAASRHLLPAQGASSGPPSPIGARLPRAAYGHGGAKGAPGRDAS